MSRREARQLLRELRNTGALRSYDICATCRQPLGYDDPPLTIDSTGTVLHRDCVPAARAGLLSRIGRR